ncbi:MAG: transcriptional coactivator p15 [Candidatus Brocadia sp. AMX2]|uniref:Transcriptional coactivator p15 n=1 Tax=Candidatus Brocadia sinica JPN1 TaxID=1197129 RepID=A0ABQ0JT40_9BACT|nr:MULTISPECIES: transcriptional coactivator p15/PC4 family protein [Brocadia]KXK30059.1 MAG: hypothetical protein UZ01_01532 [Candidatus Brocadia sinica]MBC6934139.1 transcriptional coactivator p15 [Candidatus Brocadia sp.]MBL1170747.1 transcriptional coactivator p15 [Candidatus Brocadia sp. AMX1]NOG43464.1 transcriptional coactivator p15 [Planctomycetota bacterium]GJQ48849.1 MAG: hypothetical protein HKUEN01_12350 [Candidatus Kuenenia stuttgartiensis]
MTNEQGVKFGEIQKKEGEKVVVSMKEYKGFDYLDIRTYFLNEKNEWCFTKKGITLPPGKVDILIGLLNKAKQMGVKECK